MTSRRAVLAGGAAWLGGCAPRPRGPAVPAAHLLEATVLGLPNERFCVIDPRDVPRVVAEFNEAGRRQRRHFGLRPADPLPDSSVIAFSGGGENGAFGQAYLRALFAYGEAAAQGDPWKPGLLV